MRRLVKEQGFFKWEIRTLENGLRIGLTGADHG
jgi:hypothetical protein